LMGGALAAALASSGRVLAEENHGGPDNPFILLLKGIYQPVPAGEGPANNLGLPVSTINLNDGTNSMLMKTRIYPIFGIQESTDQDRPIGTFYVQFNGNLCAYDLPGGAIAMQFLAVPSPLIDPNPLGYNDFSTIAHPDGLGGKYLEGTWELVILKATGIYQAFQGGHNHMVDRLHSLANNGDDDEFCFCIISQYQFP